MLGVIDGETRDTGIDIHPCLSNQFSSFKFCDTVYVADAGVQFNKDRYCVGLAA